jgi:hypothetical protein
MKLFLDVKKSLELCPPNYPKGVRFKKRIVSKREVVTYPLTNNPREDHILWTQVPLVKDSFSVNGYQHTVSPPTVKVDPDNKDRFIGLTGYHRDAAATQLDIETMLYDVLEFDSPLDELIHRTVSNHHRLPALTNTKDDIIKQVQDAVAKNYIPNDDDSIKNLISVLADDKTPKVQKDIFVSFRKRCQVPGATLQSYHTEGGHLSTEEFAEKHGIPFGGDKKFSSTKRLGYISGINTPKTTLFDAKLLSMDSYNGQDVEIYSWIQKDAKQAPGIYAQRKSFKSKFDKFIENDCRAMQTIAAKCGFDIPLQDLIKNHPVKLKGFLAQDITPDSTNGGNPKEVGVVDVDGKKIP